MSDKFIPKNQFRYDSKLPKTKEEWLRDSITNYKARRYDEAVTASDLAIRIDVNLGKAHHVRGLALIELELYEEAVAACEQANQLDPRIADIYVDKGIALYKLGLYEEVITVCTQAIQIDSKFLRAYHGRAVAHLALKYYEEAVDDCSKALQLDLKKTKVYITKAEAYFGLKHYQEASWAYQKAVDLNYEYRELSSAKGKELIEEGKKLFQLARYDDALLIYDQALLFCFDVVERHNIDIAKDKICVMKLDIMIKKGEELFELKNYEKARETFEKAITYNPSTQNIYMKKGQYLHEEALRLFKLKKYDEALESLNGMVRFGFKVGDAYISMMDIILASTSCEDAFEAYYKVKEYYKLKEHIYGRSRYLFYDGDGRLYALENQNEAVKTFVQAVRHGYKLAHAYSNIILIFLYRGDKLFKQRLYQEALAIYQKTLSICKEIDIELKKQPEHGVHPGIKQKVYTAIGAVQFELKHYKEAYPAYNQDILLDPLTKMDDSVKEKPTSFPQPLKQIHDGKISHIEEIVEKGIKEDKEANYVELMQEDYGGKGKRGLLEIEEVSDPDEYDENYNQYLEVDLGDELDKHYERFGLL